VPDTLPAVSIDAPRRLGGRLVYVLRVSGQPIGHCALKLAGCEAEVSCWITSPAHRGQGIGREAGRLVVERGFELGLRRIWLKTDRGNSAAIRAASAVGFSSCAVPKNPRGPQRVYMERWRT
jgi:RimJ/RimL family protein N-acetyltransferase